MAPMSLAQSGAPVTGGGAITWALLWAAVLIAAVILAAWALLLVRRRTLNHRGPGDDTGFTLNELRELHREGRMTDAEYEAARRRLLASTEHSIGRNPITGALRASPGHDLSGDRLPQNEDKRPE